MQIKIFGERNTATNALTAVLQKNCASFIYPGTAGEIDPIFARQIHMMRQRGINNEMCEIEIDKFFCNKSINFQWKHTATNFASFSGSENTFYIFLVRHPLSWTYSLYTNPYHSLSHIPNNFQKFYEMNWKLLGRDNLSVKFCRPIQLYKLKLESYVNFINQLNKHKMKYCVIRFEDFVQSQEKVFSFLKPYLDAPSDNFMAHSSSTKDENKNLDYYKYYYQNELWKNNIDITIKKEFTFDKNLLSFFGY